MFGSPKLDRFRSLASLILVVNVVGELVRKRTLAALRGFLAAARLSCLMWESKSSLQPRPELCWRGEYRRKGEGVSSVLRPLQHSIGYMGDGLYRSKGPTNSIKVLKGHI